MLLQWSRKDIKEQDFQKWDTALLQSSLYAVDQYESITSEKYQLSI